MKSLVKSDNNFLIKDANKLEFFDIRLEKLNLLLANILALNLFFSFFQVKATL